ncbi:cytochrome P450 82A4-like [Solanum lycopersicum]|uniref:cytochrome P450 82A4-like n=1 Tax=Solanum lycopersicum TaxID=4081 RepID=UPI0037489542
MDDSSNFVRIEMKEWFEKLAMTIIIRTLYGKEHDFEEGKRARSLLLKNRYVYVPPEPLSAPHESVEDCIVGGYNIPKGNRALFNLWKIQRDPSIWPEPDLFKLERFLTTHKDIDVKGNYFELIPFGAGRRICPGISSTLVSLHLTLANVLHAFEITKPSNEPIDMSSNLGIKETPLEVLLASRLSLDLYNKM